MTEAEFRKIQKDFLKKHKSFQRLEKKYPLDFRIKKARSPFETLVRSIAHQQLHGKAAETILDRFIKLYKPKRFPKADDILKTKDEKLRDCGFSASKVRSIKDIALKTKEGLVPTSAKIKKMENADIIKQLTQIYGVGRWTVEMLLLFNLGRMNVWPVDDFAIRKGYMHFKKLKSMPTAKEIVGVEDKYAPYQSLLSLYMWEIANNN